MKKAAKAKTGSWITPTDIGEENELSYICCT